MRLALDMSLGASRPSGVSYEAEATAYFAAMSVAPDATQKGHLNTLIASLKSGGVWTKMDGLLLPAVHDEQAGRVSAKDPTLVATASGTPTFTPYRGFTGNGSSMYLNTGWNPTTAASPQYTQNSAHQGVWCGTDGVTGFDMGQSNSRLTAQTTTISLRANSASNSTSSAMATSIGHTMWNRTGATTGAIYRNAGSVGSITSTSAAPANAAFFILALNASTTGTLVPGSYGDRRIQAVHWGSQLTAGEVTALYNALATYMTAVGA